MKKLNFTCCFCNLSILQDDVNPMNLNIMGNYDKILNADKLLKDLPSQEFYCHFTCFKKNLHEYFQRYFIEENFSIEENNR